MPEDLPAFPDVNGDGRVSPSDALDVIDYLASIYNSGSGEGEASTYVPVAGGVMASGATALGDDLLRREAQQTAADLQQQESKSSVSVFDSPAVVDLDEVVDSLAIDTASARDAQETNSLDDLFASL